MSYAICGQMNQMKKILPVLLLMISCYGLCQTNRQVSQLATLGKVWGFLKYYHPSALKGNPDWDKELLRLIPLVEQTAPGKSFDSLLNGWYRSLPVAKLATQPVSWHTDSMVRIFTEKDIQQFGVSGWLKNELLTLYSYHPAEKSRYITRQDGNYLLDHIYHTEDRHDKPVYPGREMRLLALFRYWNTIEYFYPHRRNIVGWDKVLPAYISRFLGAKDSMEYRYAIQELIHELPDSHSFIQLPGDNYYFYPFRLDYIQGKYIIGQCDSLIAKANDYQLGDEVMAINGKTTPEKVKELLKITTGTNTLSRYRNIAQQLLKEGDTVVQVTFKRKGLSFSKEVALHSWPVYSQLRRATMPPLWEEVKKGIWYVRFCRINNADTLKILFRDINHARAVIWDMRDYPNYNVTTQLYQYLFPVKTIFTEEKNASDLFPGSFIKSTYSFTPVASKPVNTYTGPLLVLVDEHTQSLAESVAAVLKLRVNTTTIGRQTAGTTGNITWLGLPGDISVSYTGVGVTGIHESFRQRDGVKLDIPIKLTVEIVSGHADYILEQAIEYAGKL
jgi:C-terminal processing protease CtpA/Prc